MREKKNLHAVRYRKYIFAHMVYDSKNMLALTVYGSHDSVSLKNDSYNNSLVYEIFM